MNWGREAVGEVGVAEGGSCQTQDRASHDKEEDSVPEVAKATPQAHRHSPAPPSFQGGRQNTTSRELERSPQKGRSRCKRPRARVSIRSRDARGQEGEAAGGPESGGGALPSTACWLRLPQGL